jgi:hypothetical protein
VTPSPLLIKNRFDVDVMRNKGMRGRVGTVPKLAEA